MPRTCCSALLAAGNGVGALIDHCCSIDGAFAFFPVFRLLIWLAIGVPSGLPSAAAPAALAIWFTAIGFKYSEIDPRVDVLPLPLACPLPSTPSPRPAPGAVRSLPLPLPCELLCDRFRLPRPSASLRVPSFAFTSVNVSGGWVCSLACCAICFSIDARSSGGNACKTSRSTSFASMPRTCCSALLVAGVGVGALIDHCCSIDGAFGLHLDLLAVWVCKVEPEREENLAVVGAAFPGRPPRAPSSKAPATAAAAALPAPAAAPPVSSLLASFAFGFR